MRQYTSQNRICKVESTTDTLTGRGGLALFARYLTTIDIYRLLDEKFGFLRRSQKGIPVWNVFKQILCFFADGTSRHVTHFDHLKADAGYAAALENESEEMASSYAIKRFFRAFGWMCAPTFRSILKTLFVWRLRIEKPQWIELTLDVMVMDNDEAEKREGVTPTYKKVKGFAPLQLIWSGKIVDALFRGGKKHGNHGEGALRMLRDAVRLIRRRYDADIPILIRMDSGFYDESLMTALDDLDVGFVLTGKMYGEVSRSAEAAPEGSWGVFKSGRRRWEYTEFMFQGTTWKREWRAVYTRPQQDDDGQYLFSFARPETVILTNLGLNEKILAGASETLRTALTHPETIIDQQHQRGADELPHRGLKDFGFEALPFKRFGANSAFYYCMLIAFFLFETYKEDALEDVVPVGSYATTVRRRVVDFAAKVTRSGGEIVLKIPDGVFRSMQLQMIWSRCNAAPAIVV